MTKSISNNIKKSKHANRLSEETKQFLADYHNFTNKWPTQKIAALPEINTTRQNAYFIADQRKDKDV